MDFDMLSYLRSP